MNFLGHMTGLNLPGISPFGGERKSLFEESIGGVWSPTPGFQPFNPMSPTSIFNVSRNGYNSFYPGLWRFEDELDEAESRIDEWEDGWGVDSEEEFDKQTSDVFKDNGVEAENRLTRIYRTRDNLRRMRTRFAGIEVTTDRPVRRGATSQGGVRLDLGRTNRRVNGITINIDKNAAHNNSQSERDRFPDGRVHELNDDLANGMDTLADLNRQIDELNTRLPPPSRRITPAGEPPLPTGGNDKMRSSSDSEDSDKDMKSLDVLRKMVFESRHMAQAQAQKKQINFANPPDVWAQRRRERRFWGEYEQDGRPVNVMIEWKTVNASNPPPPHTAFTFKNMFRVRVEALASLLKIPDNARPADLKVLSCLGLFRRSNDDEVTYGIVFKSPSRRHQTLLEALQKEAGFVRQSTWMQMAKSLAKTVLYHHLARWLHKGIRSSNIILFTKEDGTMDYSEPYLVGHEYSRQAGKISQTEIFDDDIGKNLYRHPRMQGLPQDSSSPTGSGSRDNSPPNEAEDLGNGNGSGPRSVPAPLGIRRDRASSNANTPPLPVRRDSSATRSGHRRQSSSMDRPDLPRRDSDRERCPFQSTHDIYSLGIVLLEIGLREPIKAIYDRAMRDPIYGKHFAEKFRQWILANEVPRLGIMIGDRYQEAVTLCLDDSLELMSEQEMHKKFYEKVVRVLANLGAYA